MPSVQFSSTIMMELVQQGSITLPVMAQKMCHAPATIFGIQERGFIREGYYADFALINPKKRVRITDQTVLSKCGWTPFNGLMFGSQPAATMVNGKFIFLHGRVYDTQSAMQLKFNNKK